MYNLYVIFHKYIIDSAYPIKDLVNSPLIFLKTNEQFNFPKEYYKKYNIIEEWSLGKFYNPELQKKTYMAPSAIYHVYKNKTKNIKYVGFIEYDMQFNSHTLTDIESIIRQDTPVIVLFSPKHTIHKLYNQMKSINGVNCIDKIFHDYNTFFNMNYNINNYMDSLVGGQQSFLCDINTFNRVMSFISYIIESKFLEKTKHRPSFLLDRYIGISLLLDKTPKKFLKLEHLNHHQW